MFITFSPMRSDETLSVSVDGDILTLNGESFDFTRIPEGALLPQSAVACVWLASDITRRDSILHLTLILPHGPDATDNALFPEPILVTKAGAVNLPNTDPEARS